jgi:hypothetical protein
VQEKLDQVKGALGSLAESKLARLGTWAFSGALGSLFDETEEDKAKRLERERRRADALQNLQEAINNPPAVPTVVAGQAIDLGGMKAALPEARLATSAELRRETA